MARKTKENDFDITRPSMGGEEPAFSGIWEVFEDYKTYKREDGAILIQAEGEVRRTYRPLADEPYLFLDLARLGAQQLTLEGLHSWLDKYGVLGMHYGGDRMGHFMPPLMYDTEGGPGETADYLAAASQEASRALSYYEAALNRDEDSLERLVGGPKVVEILWKMFEDEGRPEPSVTLTDVLVDHVMMRVWHVVQHNLSNFAYPTMNHELPNADAIPGLHTRRNLLTPNSFAVSWGFRNLLGAAYLQFYWLVDSRADLKRCEYCNRIIPLAPPTSQDGKKGRKRRKDVLYCNKSCQQNHHYRTKKKHERKSQNS